MDIEEIRRRKLLELQRRAAASRMTEEEQQALQLQQQYEIQKRKILKQILTEPARARLARLRLAKPELAAQVELQLIQLAQMGRIQVPISDEVLKSLLEKLYEMNRSKKREIKFIRK
ncbi:DNA-binding protein [Methanofervidicoccus abyssi]|uniref:DNA-binding protein MHHB_P0427 n=1 Tax=Methanofervidicoccus abyssi TaxID=2082189 RepID=A0A401HPJ4_9EURY|nr:DNA-binding protein [Methanofervidicoccus abyssi]GBF36197.1 programmed cell death protein 5 [Methanofervidicoccus abyssi]